MLILTFEEITRLREVAASTIADYPWRQCLLEMAIIGLSRWSIANLEFKSFRENVPGVINGQPVTFSYAVVWKERNNVERCTRLSPAQWQIVQDYLRWRVRNSFIKSPNVFVCKSRSDGVYSKAMKPERVRSEIRLLGKDAYVADKLEIPAIHRGMANWLRSKGTSEKIISEFYGNKIYADKSEELV